MDLNTAIDEWNTYRAGAGYSANTVAAGRDALRKFMAVTGNIQVRSLGPHHGEMFLSAMLSKGYKPAGVNLRISMVSSFCKWARDRRLMGGNQNPLATARYQTIPETTRRRIPRHEFDRLLDAGAHPQERMLLALGLYLFLRSGEITGLLVGDVDLDAGYVQVFQPKTKRHDAMPICAELDAELRRWLTWYANDQEGPLRQDWHLLPARRKRRIDLPPVGPTMNPTARMTNTAMKVHSALREIGWDVDGEDREGIHTLRRSGARALFEELTERQNRDGALRYVASMLHHKSVTQTEHYLGLDVDREKRDDLLRGERMFSPVDESNVIRLSDTTPDASASVLARVVDTGNGQIALTEGTA